MRHVRRAAAIALLVAAACAQGPADPARGDSPSGARACAARPAGHTALGDADVAFEGVALSGPRSGANGPLASPAAIQVTRYLKGRGPRVIAMGTGAPLLTTGDALDPNGVEFAHPDFGEDPFQVAPGDELRVYGHTPGGASSAARGVMWPGFCSDSRVLRPGTLTREVRGAAVERLEDMGTGWVARLTRGAGPLRCLRLERRSLPRSPRAHRVRVTRRETECGRPRRPEELLVTVASGARTPVAVAARGLVHLDVRSAGGGSADAAAHGRAGVALALLRERATARDLELRATFAGGGVVVVDLTATSAMAGDPGGERPWTVAAQAAHPQPRKPLVCATFAQLGSPTAFDTPVGECGPAGAHRRFFAVRRVVRLEPNDEGLYVQRVHRVVVFGVAGAATERIAVTWPGGSADAARARRGGAFALVLPGDVRPTDVGVTFRLAGGGERSYRGVRQANVVPPPRSALDGPG